MKRIFLFILNTYTIYVFFFIVLFATAGQLNNHINKYVSMIVVILFVVLSSYNQFMLKRELNQVPTAKLYNTGITATIQLVLGTLIYIGGTYVLFKTI